MHSPALPDELMNAIMSMEAAHQSMVRQALNSYAIRAAMLATGRRMVVCRKHSVSGRVARVTRERC